MRRHRSPALLFWIAIGLTLLAILLTYSDMDGQTATSTAKSLISLF